MRKLFLFFFTLIAINNSFSAAGWFTQLVFENRTFNDICMVNANTGYVCGSSGIILKTSNGGSNWAIQYVPTVAYGNIVSINFIDALTGWAVTGISNYAVIKTTNGGVAWIEQNVGQIMNSKPGFIYPVSSSQVYLGFISDGTNFSSAGTLLKSTDGGTSFNPVSNTNGADLKSISFINSNTGWINSYQWNDFQRITRISKTTNGGNSWTIQLYDSLNSYSYIKFFNTTSGLVFGGAGAFSNFQKTTNGGENWTSTITQNHLTNVDFINELTGWSTLTNLSDTGAVLRTTNGGINWLGTRTDRTFFISRKTAFINETTGWVIGSQGDALILKTTTGGVTFVNQTSSVIPDNFSLSQNYPNPFNPNTVVSYQLPVAGFVQLKVYDILGNEIETLVNEKQNAGSYSVDFNAASLTSGIYFYKLVTEKFSETKKMILVK